MFSLRNKKNMDTFWLKKAPYQELCCMLMWNLFTAIWTILCSALLVLQSGRLYSTKFMRVLLRAKVRSFSTWGIELLVGQLYDQSRSVALTALSILDEACEDHVSKFHFLSKGCMFIMKPQNNMHICSIWSVFAGHSGVSQIRFFRMIVTTDQTV